MPQNFVEPVRRRPHVLRKPLAFFFAHRRNRETDAAQRGVDVIDVVHEANEFPGCWHMKTLLFVRRKVSAVSTDRTENNTGSKPTFHSEWRAEISKACQWIRSGCSGKRIFG